MKTVKEVNLEQLEEKYGAELVKEIRERMEHSIEKGWDFKVEVISEGEFYAKIAYATYAFIYIYDLKLKTKRVLKQIQIGSVDCKRYLDIMNSFKA